MAYAFVQTLLENMKSLLQKDVGFLAGNEKYVETLSIKFSTISDFLEDAEKKQFTDKAISKWMRKLKNIAAEVDDVLDEYKTEAERLRDRQRSMNKVHASLTKLNPNISIYRRKVGGKLKEIQEKLAEIVDEGSNFHLQSRTADSRADEKVRPCSETIDYLVDDSEVYGREVDYEKIVECLLMDAPDSDNVSVYPIVGVGGVGKTTLAQLVFNDERIRNYFARKIWVCVPEKSPQDDFDIKSVMSAIIESLSGEQSEVLSIGVLQNRLQGLLNGKRYLLVLDDIWNDNKEVWDHLKCALSCGSKGASVVVTTRLQKVAEFMGTFPPHYLSGLSYGDSWLLFKKRAFGNESVISQNIMKIGKEIAKKCNGVPLVAKVLGGLMRFKNIESEWQYAWDTELCRLSEDENSITQALKLGYWSLPYNTKHCFAFCAMFPKDYAIPAKQLIYLWMANGFISPSETLDVEDIGNGICMQLAFRSLIQDLELDGSNNILSFKMHDLVHDLAQSVMQDECCIWKRGISSNVDTTTRHMHLIYVLQFNVTQSALQKAKSLRTLLLTTTEQFSNSSSIKLGDFSKFQTVRALVAKRISVKVVSPSIGNLLHLRHLDFSHSKIEALPETICDLWNLQSLDLIDCRNLLKLPKHMRRLRNLLYLLLNGCHSLKTTPPRLGEITGLRTLGLFIVYRRNGYCVSELENLNLRGQLHIKHLERVRNPKEAKQANLGGKANLRVLILSWEMSGKSNSDLQVLEALKPHPNLEELKINSYKGTRLPLWTGDPVYRVLVSIKLNRLEYCLELSPLGKLPSLKHLGLRHMNRMKYIDNEIHYEGAKIFPSLEELEIEGAESLERLSINEGNEMFPRFTQMRISRCPKLTLPHLASVKELEAKSCSNLFLDSISNLSNLTSLSIRNSDEVIFFSGETFRNLSSLKSLTISFCNKVQSLPEVGLQGLRSLEHLHIQNCADFELLSNGLQHLTSLQSLIIDDCPELTDFPHGFQHLVSLKCLELIGNFWGESKLAALPDALQDVPNLEYLKISDFPNLASLPEWLGNLTSLQTLKILECESLNSLPMSFQNLTKLQSLFLSGCGRKLMKQCELETGANWHKISHVPNIRFN